MDNLKRYQICYDLITYFATLISPKKSQLGLILRTEGNIYYLKQDTRIFMKWRMIFELPIYDSSVGIDLVHIFFQFLPK